MAQDCKVFRRTVFAYAAVVFAETDVQTPVQVVFDSPMVSNGLGDSRRVTFNDFVANWPWRNLLNSLFFRWLPQSRAKV